MSPLSCCAFAGRLLCARAVAQASSLRRGGGSSRPLVTWGVNSSKHSETPDLSPLRHQRPCGFRSPFPFVQSSAPSNASASAAASAPELRRPADINARHSPVDCAPQVCAPGRALTRGLGAPDRP